MIGECGHLMWNECEIMALSRLSRRFRLIYYCGACKDWVGIKRNATIADIARGFAIPASVPQTALF